jgi:glycosyltransferase involved in cell wall biosynthesis
MPSQSELYVLMISTDRNIFLEGSDANMRMKEYAALVKELSIIVFAKSSLGLKETAIAQNARAYPTDSWSRFLYISDAYGLAKQLFAPDIDHPDFSMTSKLRINLITAQDPFECGLAGYRIARLLHRPLHLQVHTDLFSPAFRKSSFLNAIRVRIAKFLFHRRADVRAVSERIRTSILHQMKFGMNQTPRITVLPVFVDTDKFINTPPSFNLHERYPGFDLLVLVVARLEKEKNVFGAIQLVEEVCRTKPDLSVGLAIVGSGSEERFLREYVAHAGIQDRVFFCGWQSDLVSYYKTADLLLVASEYEGYGRMFVEAAASGCPILTLDVGIANEAVFLRNALVCSTDDTACLYRNIVNLSSERNVREALLISTRGGAHRTKFQTKEEYLAEYRRMWEMAAESDTFAPMI